MDLHRRHGWNGAAVVQLSDGGAVVIGGTGQAVTRVDFTPTGATTRMLACLPSTIRGETIAVGFGTSRLYTILATRTAGQSAWWGTYHSDTDSWAELSVIPTYIGISAGAALPPVCGGLTRQSPIEAVFVNGGNGQAFWYGQLRRGCDAELRECPPCFHEFPSIVHATGPRPFVCYTDDGNVMCCWGAPKGIRGAVGSIRDGSWTAFHFATGGGNEHGHPSRARCWGTVVPGSFAQAFMLPQ